MTMFSTLDDTIIGGNDKNDGIKSNCKFTLYPANKNNHLIITRKAGRRELFQNKESSTIISRSGH